MRSVVLTTSLFLYSAMLCAQQSPYATRVIEYRPAPGQYINDPASGTPAVAMTVLNEPGEALSLGGYGGYIILGFDHRIMNDPANPYGVDFTVFGNAVPTHAEQGIIRVMKDENNNKIPDDTWYEIAGSDHYTGELKKNYSITYFNPGTTTACDVPWKDNSGTEGFILKNNFHTQPYYPDHSLFPQVNKDSMSFIGSRLAGNVKKIKGLYVSLPSAFGYADNTLVNPGNNYTIPDNPYTPDVIEGSGGDAIDISWAVDSSGKPVELDGVDFIMIYNGINLNAAWLGEVSTEVRGVADVRADPAIQGQSNLILPMNFPEKISVSSVLTLRSLFFQKGRLIEGKNIEWISSDLSIAGINNDSVITTYKAGTVKLSARLKNSLQILFEDNLTISTPSEIRIENIPSFILKDQVFTLNYSILDNLGDKLSGLKPEISISGLTLLQILSVDEEKLTLKAIKPGVAYINFIFAGLSKSQKIQINDIPQEFEVSVSLIRESESIIPRKSFSATKQDLQKYIDRMEEGFVPGRNFVTIADVLVSVLLKEGYGSGSNSFRFRQDDKANHKLYLWQFGRNYEYTYGWGGTELNDANVNTWIAIVNNKVFPNAWDTIKVQPDDIISFRHVKDIRNEWTQIQLVPEKQISVPGEEIGFTVRKLVVTRNQGNELIVSGPFLLPDAEVLVNESSIPGSNSVLVSDYTGKFKLKFKAAGRYSVGINNAFSEETEINVGYSLENHDFEMSSMNVYPNPCINEIHVKTGNSLIKNYKIVTIDGRVIRNEVIPNGEKDLYIDLSTIERGVYILELSTGGMSFTKMIIKNQE